MASRRVFVLWSGGADSTCLVEQLLADETVEMVMAGYVFLANQRDKAESELAAIAKMAEILRARDGRFAWMGVICEIEFHRTNRNLAYKQVPPWLLAAVEAINVTVDEIAIGYIKNSHPEVEDVTAHLGAIRAIYDAYRPLMHREMPRLSFPILELTKREVIERLSPEIRALCVWCEQPIRDEQGFRACGRCRTCGARAEALG